MPCNIAKWSLSTFIKTFFRFLCFSTLTSLVCVADRLIASNVMLRPIKTSFCLSQPFYKPFDSEFFQSEHCFRMGNGISRLFCIIFNFRHFIWISIVCHHIVMDLSFSSAFSALVWLDKPSVYHHHQQQRMSK